VANDRTIDDVDVRILNILQENARTTQSEIAKTVGLAPSAVLERVRKLEGKGCIREYVASIDPHIANRPLLAFVAVRTSEYGPERTASSSK
jgi:Lrp/AsnC family leucine-responsive transcriptional regulator